MERCFLLGQGCGQGSPPSPWEPERLGGHSLVPILAPWASESGPEIKVKMVMPLLMDQLARGGQFLWGFVSAYRGLG